MSRFRDSPQISVPLDSSQEVNPPSTAILEQLERILKSSFFRKSQRYTAFLRYSVERVLAGQNDSLKERIVGIEVFGRPADYNTAVDHVVRSAAGEIRKRLALYYQDRATESELRIDLEPGSYVPHFVFRQDEPVAIEKPTITSMPASRNRMRRWTILGIVALSVLALLTASVLYKVPHRTALDLFWSPILSSRSPVILCIGNPPDEIRSAEVKGDAPTSEMHFPRSNRVSFASATTLARLAGLLQSRGKQYQVLLRSATKFSDLQQGPSVLIGGFNNGWTLRLADTLRFGFERQPGQPRRIRDRRNPARTDWSVDFSVPYGQITRDYAIVSRVQDPKTEQTTVIVAGIAQWGTVAAGEFITNPTQIQKLQTSAPKGWERMNMQLVLSTDVIDGVSGPPKIVATQFW